MSQSKLTVKPSDRCFLCLKHFPLEDPEENADDKERMFKLLLRYLKIEGFEKASDPTADKVGFCERCEKLMAEFYQWYEHLEAVRLCLGSCVDALVRVMEVNQGQLGELDRVTGSETGLGNEAIFGMLRNNVMDKCRAKLLAKPVVRLEKCQVLATHQLRREELLNSTEPMREIPVEDEFTPPLTPQDTTTSSIEVIELTDSEEECNKVSDSKKLRFINVARRSKRHFCSICRKSFCTRGALLLHQRSHQARSQVKKNPKNVAVVTMKPAEATNTSLQMKENEMGKSTCKFCKRAVHPSYLDHHYVVVHTFEHFSSLLPSGTTLLQLEEAITSITIKHMDKERLKFSKCKDTLWPSTVRIHVLKKHWHDIIDAICGADKEKTPVSMKLHKNKCRSCHRSFRNRRALGIHERVHKDRYQLTRNGRFSCEFCKKTFLHKSTATRHAIGSHTHLLFSEELPLGTTLAKLKEAIETNLMKYFVTKSWICLLCKKVCRNKVEARLHFIRKHLEQVIKEL